MAIDDRILYLVRQEITEVADAIGAPGWSEHINDLHRELHELATRLTRLERRLSNPEPLKPATRASTRKAPGE